MVGGPWRSLGRSLRQPRPVRGDRSQGRAELRGPGAAGAAGRRGAQGDDAHPRSLLPVSEREGLRQPQDHDRGHVRRDRRGRERARELPDRDLADRGQPGVPCGAALGRPDREGRREVDCGPHDRRRSRAAARPGRHEGHDHRAARGRLRGARRHARAQDHRDPQRALRVRGRGRRGLPEARELRGAVGRGGAGRARPPAQRGGEERCARPAAGSRRAARAGGGRGGRVPAQGHAGRADARPHARTGPALLHHRGGSGATLAAGRAGGPRQRIRFRDRGRGLAGPGPRAPDRAHDVRQGPGADRVPAARDGRRAQAHDRAVLHAERALDPSGCARHAGARRGRRRRRRSAGSRRHSGSEALPHGGRAQRVRRRRHHARPGCARRQPAPAHARGGAFGAPVPVREPLGEHASRRDRRCHAARRHVGRFHGVPLGRESEIGREVARRRA